MASGAYLWKDAPMRRQSDRPRVLIAGGGVAALEACLALRERLRADKLEITLVAPTERFDYRLRLDDAGAVARRRLVERALAAERRLSP